MVFAGLAASAQEVEQLSQMDSIVIANPFRIQADGNMTVDATLTDRSPEIDVGKALYGQFSGLLVKQGSGRSEDNEVSLRLRGHRPLVLVDGYPRDLSDVTNLEIESITVLKDAVSAAIYGVRGANGAILITTRRGKITPLQVSAKYQTGIATMFRAPDFADAYTYGVKVNEALRMDGLEPRYSDLELEAFRTGSNPYAYPDVNWWDQIYRDYGDNHRMQLTFTGGSRNFRYFTAVDYYKDNAIYVNPTSDNRYNAHTYDNRLGIRANVDVNLTETTSMKVGVMARLSEFNRPYWENISGDSIEETLYTTPAAAFPIKTESGIYGGSDVYGANNPVALHQESGNHLYSQTKVLADMVLRQDLDSVVKGLYLDANVAFDFFGKMTEVSKKTYRYAVLNSTMDDAGVVTTTESIYGVDSKTMGYDNYFNTLSMRFDMQMRANWERSFGEHHVDVHAGYRQRSYVQNSRNKSTKTQEILGTASWNWKNTVFADVAMNYSGTAYLPKGQRFNLYPAVNVAAIVMREPYVKVFGSAGLSGYDLDMAHELALHTYGDDNAKYYYFTDKTTGYYGYAEGDLPALTLMPEQAERYSLGVDTRLFGNRLAINAEAFYEDRTGILIDPENISEVIGIGLKSQSLGENTYKGIDLATSWNDKIGDIKYGVYANAGWLFTKVVNNGEAYQEDKYLYRTGYPVNQCYGLEVIGIFQNQYEINNSPRQTFGDVRPGDLKYRDQNGDGVINDKDVVRMFGSTDPLLQFGFGLNMSWKSLSCWADFQGQTGVTVNLLNSPLYQPVSGDNTISNTFLDREVTWTPETAATATMPRLTTGNGKNNYRKNSLWYRDGSFIKLRSLGVSYTLPRKLTRNICDTTLSLSATNLFCCDNIGFADPEQLYVDYPSTRVFWGSIKFNF